MGASTAAISLAGCQAYFKSEDDNGAGGNSNGGGDGPLSGRTIRIGVMCPDIQGFYHGQVMWDAAELVEDLWNQDGGIAGATVEMVQADTGLTPRQGRREFIRLATEENVDVVTGGLMDDVVLQCLEPMRDHGVPYVSVPNQGLRQIRILRDRYDEFKLHFRPAPMNGDDVAMSTVELCRWGKEKLGWETIGILSENLSFFDITHEVWEEELPKHFEVPISRRASEGTRDWTPFFDEMEDENVDLALFVNWLTGTGSVTQWANQERPFEYGGITGPHMTPPSWDNVGGRNRYVWNMNTTTPTFAGTDYAQEFIRMQYDEFDRVPTWSSGWWHDAVTVYRRSIEDAVEDLGEMPDPETWIDYMLDVEISAEVANETMVVWPWFSFHGADEEFPHTARWTCASEWGDCDDPMGTLGYFQWQKNPDILPEGEGAQQHIFPEISALNDDAEYHFPHWIDYPDDHPANDSDAYGYQPGS